MIDFIVEQEHKSPRSIATIKVLGIGGAGGNTVNSLIDSGYEGIEFIVGNTDVQALDLSKAPYKMQLGMKSTKGLGTGANPELGKRAAQEDLDQIMERIGNADIVFLAGGMGGGTGSGALPVIAAALKEKGILSIAVVTKPFIFEGKRRARVADEAIEQLKQHVDTLIVVPNQKLLELSDKNISMIDAFAMINNFLSQSVQSISDLISKPGHINVDFADVRTVMKDRGLAVMGTGRASGEGRAGYAALQAISSPLLENMSIKGARGVLMNITGGLNLGLHEISEAASVIYEQAHEDAHIILGSVIDENLTDEVIVTIVATGFEKEEQVQPAKAVESLAINIPVQQVVAPMQSPIVEEPVVVQEVVEEPIVAHKEVVHHASKEVMPKEETPALSLEDMNNLDIPAFLRRQMQQHKSE